MSDSISRQTLLNAYKDYKDFDKVFVGSLRAEINAQPPAQPHWIPVTEGLPEKDESVLIHLCCIYGNPITIGWLSDDDEWVIREGMDFTFDDVVAWMPLPEHYKEVTE